MYLIICKHKENLDCFSCGLGGSLESIIAIKPLMSVSSKEIESNKFFNELKNEKLLNENESADNVEFKIVEVDPNKIIDVSWRAW